MLPPVRKQKLSTRLTCRKRKYSMSQMDAEDIETTFTDDQRKDVEAFFRFFTEVFDDFTMTSKHFLAEDVVLDFFGHTVKGQKDVTCYLLTHVTTTRHVFGNVKPVNKIGFRDTHVVELKKEPELPVGLFSPPATTKMQTPVKSEASTSAQRRSVTRKCLYPSSPAKRLKFEHEGAGDASSNCVIEDELVDNNDQAPKLKYMMAEGFLEFGKPSLKKLQKESKWRRSCKLSIAFSTVPGQDCRVHLIIYEGNMKCKRNLLKEFDDAAAN